MRTATIKKVSIILAILMICVSCGNNILTPDELDPTEYLGKYTVEKDGAINYTKDNAKFAIEKDDCDLVLKLKMYQVKFDDNMPITLNIVAKDLPYTEVGDTSIVTIDKVVPTVGGVPMGAYALLDLDIKVTKKSLAVEFVCKDSQVRYNGKK